MLILLAEFPQGNSYNTSLIKAYEEQGQTVVCDHTNFFYSNIIPDMVHVQWPERLYHWYPLSEKADKVKIEILHERLKWYKNNGAIIVFTIHDLVLHNSDNRRLDNKIFNLILEYSDIISHHCSNSVKLFAELYPLAMSKINIINFHGDYLIDYKYVRKEEARSKLNIPYDKFVILNFGAQYVYKGRGFIEKVFNSCSIDSKYLLSAGVYSYIDLFFIKKLVLEIRNDLRVRRNFSKKKYLYRSIKNDEIPTVFNASDVVFLGHRSGLNTGIIPLAATYAKPVIYPELGCFKESAKDWAAIGYEPGNVKQGNEALNELYDKLKKGKINLDNSEWLEKKSWKNHVELILKTVTNFKKV